MHPVYFLIGLQTTRSGLKEGLDVPYLAND